MDTKAVVVQRIEALCKERGITIHALSYISGVAGSTNKGIFFNRSKNPGILTIKKLCDGFDITLGEFFSTPEIDALEQEIK